MKIVFFGDSITDMGRSYDQSQVFKAPGLGFGYVQLVASYLNYNYPNEFEIYNKGVSGNRIVDLYARIKEVWNVEPDLLSILIGVNDVWHELDFQNGVELDRFDKVYRMMIDDTLKKYPNMKIVLCEPFVLDGEATHTRFNQFKEVYSYAKVVQKIAEDYQLIFVPLQEKFNNLSMKFGTFNYLFDGVHPNSGGAQLIANELVSVIEKVSQENK